MAVLPFDCSSDEILRPYFVDGVTHRIIGALARIPDLVVMSPATMLRFRDRRPEAGSLGAELGVRFVVCGSVSRQDQELTFVYHLWDAALSSLIWTGTITSALDDLFDTEHVVVSRIVNGILPEIRNAEIARALLQPANSLTAYDFMLRALPGITSLDRTSFEESQRLLDQAMTLDATYGMPYAWAARLQSLSVGQGWASNRAESCAEALRLTKAALAHDPMNTLALAAAGHVHSYLLHDYDAALELFDRAISICPSDPLALGLSSLTLSYCGQAEAARRNGEHALKLSPMDPALHHLVFNVALADYIAGDYARAEAGARRSIAENARWTSSYKILAASLAGQGRLSEAREVACELLRLEPAFEVLGARICPLRDPQIRSLYMRQLRAAGAIQPEVSSGRVDC